MTTPTEASGDYGYDLVHEEVRAARAADRRPDAIPDPLRPQGSDPRNTRGSGDFSYDQAHGF